MRRAVVVVSLLVAGWMGLQAAAARASVDEGSGGGPSGGVPRSEDLHYEWRLEGLSGILAKLLTRLPTNGDAVIALDRRSNDRLEVAFTATSEKATADDFFKYESLVDPGAWRSLRVTETLHFRNKKKSKTVDLGEIEVIDVLSGLQQLRYVAAKRTGRQVIWSDGKVYPVAVASGPLERRQVNGTEVMVRHLEIRGLKEPKRHLWKARADLWLTDDEAAVPVEIVFHQALGRLRMTLVEPPNDGV